MRTIVIAIYLAVYTLITYPLRIIYKLRNISKEEKENLNYTLLRKLVHGFFKISGAKIQVTGYENIKEDSAYLYMANHKSNIDSLLFIWLLKKPVIFIGKKELKKVPLVSGWFKDIGCLFLDRENVRQAVNTINEGITNLKNGRSVIIFPEGKRIIDNTLGEFKDGSFKLAIKSKVKIVPIAFIDTHKVLEEKKSIKPENIYINIGEDIDWEKIGITKTRELCNYTKERIQHLLNDLSSIS